MIIKVWWTDGPIDAPTRKQFEVFIQKMSNRLIAGFYRYGKPKEEKKYLTRLVMEVKAYHRNGNAEHLYNIANYCVLEAMAPENKKFHSDPLVESVTRGKM